MTEKFSAEGGEQPKIEEVKPVEKEKTLEEILEESKAEIFKTYKSEDKYIPYIFGLEGMSGYQIAEKIAEVLGNIAHYTKDKEVLIESIKTIQAYEKNPEIAETIAEELGDIAHYIKDKEALIESIKTIQTYEKNPKVAGIIAWKLGNIAKDINNKEALIESIKTIQAYEKNPEIAETIAGELGNIAHYIKGKEALIESIKTIQTYEKNPKVAGTIAERLGSIAKDINNKEAVKFASQAYQNKDVIKVIKTYEKNPEVAKEIAWGLGNIAAYTYTKDKEALIESIKTIQTYEKNPKVAGTIAEGLGNIAENTKDKEVVLFSAGLISSSKGVSSHDLMRLRSLDLRAGVKTLKKLLEKGDFSEKVKRISIFQNLKYLDVSIEDPDLTGEWLEKAGKAANLKLKEKFEIERDLTLNESLALLSIKAGSDEIEMIGELLDSKIEKSFPLNKIYEKIDIDELKKEGDPIEVTKSLIPVLLTTEERAKKDIPRHYANLRKALSFFSAEQLGNARDLVRRKEPKKIFFQLKNDIELVKQNNPEAAKRIRDYFKDLAKKELEGKTPEDAEALSDLMDAIESIGKARVFESLIIKTQKGDATDLMDCRTTGCCAFYPDGANSEASIYYLKDPEIGLLWLKSATYQGEELDNLGVAIMANCKDSEGKRVLMIDSVEGGEALQRTDVKWQEKVLETIKKIAQENKQDYIVFNSRVNNLTPNNYNKFLEKTGLKKAEINLEKINGIKAIEDWEDEHYLEAFGGWEFPKGKVSGYKALV